MPTRILVVEDSPTQAEKLRSLLESAGYEVVHASSGEAAIIVFDSAPFDVVISDIVMPGRVDGYALCRHIKSGPARSTPVVLLTSLNDALDIIQGLEVGADNFFTKPYDPDHFLARLAVLLQTREVRATRDFRVGIDIFFMGRRFTVSSDREQILDLLISTFEDAVRQNRELRRREEELEAAKRELASYAETLEARLANVLSSVPDVLFSASPDLETVHYVSPASRRVFGREPEEMGAGGWQSGLHPADRERTLAAMANAVAAGKSVTLEYRFNAGDKGPRWVSQVVVPVRDPTGRVVRIDGIARDITEHRQLEEQFRQSQKMESIGRLAGGVAHDFNNLLTVILGESEIAMNEMTEDDPARSSFVQIVAAAERAAELTRQLLALSRQQVLEVQVVNVNDVLANLQKMMRRLIGEDVAIVSNFAPDIDPVQVNPGQLEQVLVNLVVNARDAMPSGGTLTIETANVALDGMYALSATDVEPGEYVLISVSDSGSGMTDDVRARIFDPFFSTKAPGKGTGLGLATCYGIVKQAGGHIAAYSEVGIGTTMKVYLPHTTGELTRVAARAASTVTAAHELILLVEDDAAVQEVTARMLMRHGYRVLRASNGREALELLRDAPQPIDLLLTDVVMPEMGGKEIARRAAELHPGLKVLFVSGYTSDVTFQRNLLDQGVALLQKPFSANLLQTRVRELLDAP